MSSIVFLSPIFSGINIQTGLEIRIKQIEKWFTNRGFETHFLNKLDEKVIDNSNIVYTPISTNPISISHQFITYYPYSKPLIVDLYTPVLLEKEASFSFFNPLHQIIRFKKQNLVKKMLKSGTHFIVANHRQQNYWLKTSRVLGVSIKKNDISILPTGVPKIKTSRLPIHKRKTIVWFGGIYPWMNPFPLIDAFSNITYNYSDWKLRFLGGFQPKSSYQSLFNTVSVRARNKIPQSQLEFIPWQNFVKLNSFLEDVAFAIHIPKESREDYFAHRVRLLTLLNTNIPVFTAGKDIISDLIVKYKAGERISNNPKTLGKTLTKVIKNLEILKKYIINTKKMERMYIEQETEVSNLIKFLKDPKVNPYTMKN